MQSFTLRPTFYRGKIIICVNRGGCDGAEIHHTRSTVVSSPVMSNSQSIDDVSPGSFIFLCALLPSKGQPRRFQNGKFVRIYRVSRFSRPTQVPANMFQMKENFSCGDYQICSSSDRSRNVKVIFVLLNRHITISFFFDRYFHFLCSMVNMEINNTR